MATVTNGTSTVPVEIVAARLRRPLRREAIGLLNVAAPQIQAGTPALLAGQITYLTTTLADALALDALYAALNPLTLNATAIEVRRNLISNPQGTVDTGTGWNIVPRWGGTGASVSTTTEATAVTLPDGTQVDSFRRKTYTVVPTAAKDSAWQFMVTSTNRAPVTAGKTYTLQYAWRKSFLGTQTLSRFEVRFYTDVSAGTEVGTTVVGPTLTNPAADTWQQDAFTFTVPATATHCVIYHYYAISDFAIIVVGSTFDATAVLVEESPVRRSYFDGGHSPDPALTPAWVGAANASPSILTRADLEAGLTGFKHSAVGTTEMVAEKPPPGRSARWLYSVDVVEVP